MKTLFLLWKFLFLLWQMGQAIVANASMVLSFLMGLGISGTLIAATVGTHLGAARLRRRARVFISFQHRREPDAKALAAELAQFGLEPVRLPYEENPDHDTLLERVTRGIRECDVFVCFPGDDQSFVDNEVFLASGLEKPVLFVSNREDVARVPNTGKKGNPIFAAERLRSGGYHTLNNFCSYLAADYRSTLNLYLAVLDHWFGVVCGIFVWYCVLVVAITIIDQLTGVLTTIGAAEMVPRAGDARTVVAVPGVFAIAATSVVGFLTVYAQYVRARFVARSKVRRVVNGQRFTESFVKSVLPATLAHSLTREDLLAALHGGEPLAPHEAHAPAAAAV